jgi:xylulose-5-phosphate/fructose-6-phosphate phosphoketolase
MFSCYEAFIHVIDSMFNQHAKWLDVTRHLPWRKPISSLNYLLTSHVWRQDHNGFSHQDPGFMNVVANNLPQLKIRVVNIVDLMTLQSKEHHPHGHSDEFFDRLFTQDCPVIFAFHGYPNLIHQLTYKRANHHNIHVHGFMEKGSTTTPFDMTVINKLDRYHLALDAIERTPGLKAQAGEVIAILEAKLAEHHDYIREYGEDIPEVRDWF